MKKYSIALIASGLTLAASTMFATPSCPSASDIKSFVAAAQATNGGGNLIIFTKGKAEVLVTAIDTVSAKNLVSEARSSYPVHTQGQVYYCNYQGPGLSDPTLPINGTSDSVTYLAHQ